MKVQLEEEIKTDLKKGFREMKKIKLCNSTNDDEVANVKDSPVSWRHVLKRGSQFAHYQLFIYRRKDETNMPGDSAWFGFSSFPIFHSD